jgi:dihydroxyacid dehydratase/phosphogluconate dehydratase
MLRDGDLIEIRIDTRALVGSVDFVGTPDARLSPDDAAAVLAAREPHPGLRPHPRLPDDTRLWAALQEVSGGTWGGAVFDTERILEVLAAGRRALGEEVR